MEDSRVEAEAATNALSVLKKTLKGEKKQERKKLETGCLVIRDSACGHDNDDDEAVKVQCETPSHTTFRSRMHLM